jgi:DAK2 domain fusion protein YloV
MRDPSIVRFRGAVAAACAELERRRQEVNDLNVFPVADGDTGDNMAMTMRAVLDELDRLNGQPIDAIGRNELVHAVARAALLGARGNSGVILSQIVRGAAEELVSRPGEPVDPTLVAAGFARAADAAYASVREPVEGTMLSAVRAMAHCVVTHLAHTDAPRLAPDVSPDRQDALLAEVLEKALEAGTEAVNKGPEQLVALREAGVVDAGAYGLTVIMAGVITALRGDGEPVLEHQKTPSHSLHLPQHESSRFRYCTNFAVIGDKLERNRFIEQLEELGDCVLVVGDDKTLKVHIHTDEPDAAASLFESVGEVSHFDVADMDQQTEARSLRLSGGASVGQKSAVVAIACGSGVVRMYEQLGALVVAGGKSLNPSTYEVLAAIHAARAEEVVVLPNSANAVMACERAAELSERPVEVVDIYTEQAGLAALLAFDPTSEASDNARVLVRAAAEVRTGAIAQAARDDVCGRFGTGDALGYVGDELVAWGELSETLKTTLTQLCNGYELVTALAGDEAPFYEQDFASALPNGVELDYQQGDQPTWWWLLWAE